MNQHQKKLIAELEEEERAEKEKSDAEIKAKLEKAADEFFEQEAAEKARAAAAANPPQVVTFDPAMFAQAVGAAIAASIPEIAKAMRQAEVNPEIERIKALRKQAMRETQVEEAKAKVDKWLSCSHMRTHPYSGTARIGWAQQSDGLVRGTCMGCGCPFTPVENELPDPVRMRGLYEKMRQVPVSIAHNDFASGMVVAGQPA